MQNHGDAGCSCARNGTYARDIYAALLQAPQRDLAQRIVADARLKSDTAAKDGEIVGHDRRGGAQREHHAVRQQFAFGKKLFRQTVQNEVEIQFAGNGDIKPWHGLGIIPA